MDTVGLPHPVPALTELVNTLYLLLRHPALGFEMTSTPDGSGLFKPVIQLAPMLQPLRQFPVGALCDHWSRVHPNEIHPYLVEYMRVFAGVDLNAVLDHPFDCMTSANGCQQFLAGKLADLRRRLRQPEVRRALYRFNFHATPRTKTFSAYIDTLFEHYSRLLVVRIDLGYRKGIALKPVFAPADGVSAHQQGEAERLAYETVRQHRQDLFDFLRSTFGKELYGYIWKLEYGFEKGYHYHLMLFFNGAKLRCDVKIGLFIGKYWDEFITADRGTHFNCNARKDQYSDCGIGMVSHGDTDKRKNLKAAATYLGKHDGLVRQDLARFQRIMGTGRSAVQREPTGPRRGRPRKV